MVQLVSLHLAEQPEQLQYRKNQNGEEDSMATEYINKIKTPDGVTRNIQDSEVPSWAKQPSKPTYTKSEVGLGNVPNVATDNQTPTVTEATTRANLASGDTLKTIISKIKKFFTDLKTVAFTGSYTDLLNKPSNNVTGSGTNNYLTKFSGTNTITNGPAIGSAVSTQTQETKFLREDGTWSAPTYTTNTDEKVTQANDATNANRRILLGDGSGDDTRTAGVKKSSYFTFNPSTHNMFLGGSLNGYVTPSGIDAASTSITSAFSKVSQSSMPYLTLTLEKPMFSALDNLLCLTFLLTNTNSSDTANSGFFIQAEDADLPLVSFNNTTLKNLIGREIIDAVCVFGGVNRALNGSRGDAPFIYNVVHDKTNNYLKPILSYSNKPSSANFYLDTSTKTKYKALRFTMLFNLSKT